MLRKILSVKSKIKGDIIIIEENDTKKEYLVIESRKLVPWLDEPKGYFLTLKEVKNEQI